MNIAAKINQAASLKDTLAQQIKSIEEQSLGLQQRHQILVLSYTRAEGALKALEELRDEFPEEPEAK